MKTTTLHITGMACAHCERSVEQAIRNAGATGKADHSAGLAQVTYDENTDQLAKIRAAITEAGYQVND